MEFIISVFGIIEELCYDFFAIKRNKDDEKQAGIAPYFLHGGEHLAF